MSKNNESFTQHNMRLTPELIRTFILEALNDGEFHSGEALARQFRLSRSAISNHIKALNELGAQIFSIKGRGYKLANEIELLSKHDILSFISHSNKFDHDISNLVHIENVISSTNDAVKQVASNERNVKSGYCCLAEAQTAGRGRRGRQWVSPYGSSLYFSMLWHFDAGYQAMSGLSIMVGVVLNQTLIELGITTCKLKWPNDLYYQQQKLAGILIEVEGQVDGNVSAIIGIGLNMQLPDDLTGIEQAFTDVNTISIEQQSKTVSRNELASLLIRNLWHALPTFEAEGLTPFLEAWHQVDLYLNKPIKLISGQNEMNGISRGITDNGALLVESFDKQSEQPSGQVDVYYGGEISVRAG